MAVRVEVENQHGDECLVYQYHMTRVYHLSGIHVLSVSLFCFDALLSCLFMLPMPYTRVFSRLLHNSSWHVHRFVCGIWPIGSCSIRYEDYYLWNSQYNSMHSNPNVDCEI